LDFGIKKDVTATLATRLHMQLAARLSQYPSVVSDRGKGFFKRF
jgi:hypothetical protein